MPSFMIRPIGNGKFQTPNGVFNSYQEAARSLGIQPEFGTQQSFVNPMDRPKQFGDVLESADINNPFRNAGQPAGAITPAMERTDVQLHSSPMTFNPMDRQKQYGGRGEVGMPKQGLLNPQQQQQSAQAPSFMDKLTSSDGLMSIGSLMLSMSQDPSLQRIGAAGMQQAMENKNVNKTVLMLRQQGENDLADLIEKNPTIGKTALTQWLQQKYGTKSGIKSFEPKIDEATGRYYIIKQDPNTGRTWREELDATGLTSKEKADLETNSALRLADMKQSQTAAADAYKQFSNLSSQIRNLETIKSSLKTGDARTGIVDQFLPAFTEATATLRSAANSLGIDVINSATFGALSATELKLALDTALPQGLDEQQLMQWVDKKLEAQKKLQAEIAKQADKLASGVPYTQWVKDVVKPFTEDQVIQQPQSSSTVKVKY